MSRERARVVSALVVAVIFAVAFDWRLGAAFFAGSLWPTIVAPVPTSGRQRGPGDG